jgi:hypothetical protein
VKKGTHTRIAERLLIDLDFGERASSAESESIVSRQIVSTRRRMINFATRESE